MILTLLSEEGCQIRAVAKGVRRPGSRFGGRLEPYAVVDLLLHSGRNLDVVNDARTVESHKPLREDFDRATAAAIAADFLDKATMDADPEPVLFELALATYAAMSDSTLKALPALTAAFLLKAVSMTGLRPVLASCAACEGPVAGEAVLSPDAGGTVCAACAGGDPGAVALSANTLAALRALMSAKMSEVDHLCIDGDSSKDVLFAMRAFVGHHVPARLRALDFALSQVAAGVWPSVDPPAAVG